MGEKGETGEKANLPPCKHLPILTGRLSPVPAFAPAPPQVGVLVEGRWRTGDNLEEVSTGRESVLSMVLVKNYNVCPQKGK